MNHKAPAVAPEIQALRSLTRTQGDDQLVEDLDQLLWQINAPDHLRAFIWLINRIQVITRAIEPCVTHGDDQAFVGQTLRWIDWFHAQGDSVNQLRSKFPSLFEAPSAEFSNPMQRYGMSRHGMYSALFHSHITPALRLKWDLLAGHLLISHARVMRQFILRSRFEQYTDDEEISGFPNSPYTASLALRQISRLADLGQLKANLEHAPHLFAKLSWRECGSLDLANPALESILRFIAKANNVMDWVTARGNTQTRSGRKSSTLRGFIDLDRAAAAGAWIAAEQDVGDPWSIEEASLIVQRPLLDAAELDALDQADLLAEELDSGDRLILAPADCQKPQRGAMSGALAAKGRLKSLERQAQNLPWQFSQLTDLEVFNLTYHLNKEIRDILAQPQAEQSRLRLESCFVLRIMLATGASLQRAHRLDLIDKQNHRSEATLSLYRHALTPGTQPPHEWRIKTVYPTYRSEPTFNKSLMRERHTYFFLPDLLDLGKTLLRTLGKPKHPSHSRRLFTSKLDACTQDVKDLLKKLFKNGRPTLLQIELYLYRRLASVTNDTAASALITGRQEYANQTRIFYTTHNLNYLRQVYRQALLPLLGQMTAQDLSARALVETKDMHLGARYCLKTESYREALEQLVADIVRHRHYTNGSEFMDFHNLLTFYVTLFWSLATAARAIKNPLISAEAIDAVTGLTTVADKDSTPPYHARLVWVPRLLHDQLTHYQDHISLTRAHLKLRFATALEAWQAAAFFITDKGRTAPITPSTLQPYFKAYLDAPANAHRRYLRTELLQRGMDVESVDSLMGHWSLGEEPWGRFSSFSVPRHIENLRRFLEPLLDELGFVCLRSPLIRGEVCRGLS